MTEFTEISVLDLAPLMNDGDTTQLAIDFANAYGNTGFGYIINHGVDPQLRKDIFAASKQLHALSEAQKQAIALDKNHRGYIGHCCKSLTTKDSLRESMALDAVHEQAISRPLSHDELVQLQRVTQEAGVSAHLGRQGHDLARAA